MINVEKTPHADLLREIISFAGQRLTELEVEGQSKENHQGLAQRNSYRDRIWETGASAVELCAKSGHSSRETNYHDMVKVARKLIGLRAA
jgi:hypothetical protein